MLRQLGIQSIPITVKNPKSNIMTERLLHQTMDFILRMMLNLNPLVNKNDTNQIVDYPVTTYVHLLQYVGNHTMEISPGALMFISNMMMNVPFIANLYSIQQTRTRQHQI